MKTRMQDEMWFQLLILVVCSFALFAAYEFGFVPLNEWLYKNCNWSPIIKGGC